ncbi:MAG: pilin [bacterium]|nr:pilin [bacterium]
MKRKLSLTLLIAIAFFQVSLLFPVQPVMADESLLGSQYGFKENGEIKSAFGPEDPADIRYTAARIIVSILSLIGIIFVIILVIAGFKYMTAAGNEEQTRAAIKQITQGVIGLLIILGAWGITYFIMRNLAAAVGNNPLLP